VAIFYEDDLPAEWSAYKAANVEFFRAVGSPGGASRTGPLPYDAPLVAAVEPKA
jgi:hypothetical protein